MLSYFLFCLLPTWLLCLTVYQVYKITIKFKWKLNFINNSHSILIDCFHTKHLKDMKHLICVFIKCISAVGVPCFKLGDYIFFYMIFFFCFCLKMLSSSWFWASQKGNKFHNMGICFYLSPVQYPWQPHNYFFHFLNSVVSLTFNHDLLPSVSPPVPTKGSHYPLPSKTSSTTSGVRRRSGIHHTEPSDPNATANWGKTL